jgi:hypothetical protein
MNPCVPSNAIGFPNTKIVERIAGSGVESENSNRLILLAEDTLPSCSQCKDKIYVGCLKKAESQSYRILGFPSTTVARNPFFCSEEFDPS